jgi:hypothetical protein
MELLNKIKEMEWYRCLLKVYLKDFKWPYVV